MALEFTDYIDAGNRCIRVPKGTVIGTRYVRSEKDMSVTKEQIVAERDLYIDISVDGSRLVDLVSRAARSKGGRAQGGALTARRRRV